MSNYRKLSVFFFTMQRKGLLKKKKKKLGERVKKNLKLGIGFSKRCLHSFDD